MAVDSKQLLKAFIKRIHPDLFSDHPHQRDTNTEALAVSYYYFDLVPWNFLQRCAGMKSVSGTYTASPQDRLLI